MTVGLAVALLLPWLAGTLAVRRLTARCHWAVALGYGYPVGVLLSALVLYLLDIAGIPLSFGAAAGIQVVVVLLLPGLRRSWPAWPRPAMPSLSCWQWAMTVLLLALLAYRFGVMWLDSWYRPAYAWDTVMNFAPKARVWFEYRALVPFEFPADWLAHPDHGAYTLSNSQAVAYPPLVPLVMLWTALGAGQWADNLVTLPWVVCGLALALGVYGQLRAAGTGLPGALLPVYLLLSLPLLNVHMTLGGYADLWVAVGLALAVLAWLRARTGDVGQWWLVVATLVLVVLAKRSGLVWVAVLAGCALLERLPRRAALAVAGGTALLVVFILANGGVAFEFAGLGPVEISAERITIPYLVDARWQFTDISPVLWRSLFLSGNWHLFWYAFVVLLGLGLASGRVRADGAGPLLLVLGLAMTFCIIFFAVPRYSGEALNQVTLNRALLQLVPAWLLVLCWWYRDWLAWFSTRSRPGGEGR